MKIIIDESLYNKIKDKVSLNQNNKGIFSTVFLYKDVVEKVPKNNQNEYSDEEMEKFYTMENFPDIFPTTEVISNKKILQKKVDTDPINSFMNNGRIFDNSRDYISLFRSIAGKGLQANKERYEFLYYVTPEHLRPMFKEFCRVANLFSKKIYSNFYEIDLNWGNWGMDGKKIKIIDF